MKLKPGISTTEFALTLATGVIAVALEALGQIEGEHAVAACTLLSAVYTICRARIKRAHAISNTNTEPPSAP